MAIQRVLFLYHHHGSHCSIQQQHHNHNQRPQECQTSQQLDFGRYDAIGESIRRSQVCSSLYIHKALILPFAQLPSASCRIRQSQRGKVTIRAIFAIRVNNVIGSGISKEMNTSTCFLLIRKSFYSIPTNQSPTNLSKSAVNQVSLFFPISH